MDRHEPIPESIVTSSTPDLQNASEVIDLFEKASAYLETSDDVKGCTWRLPDKGRLVVTGDLHDNPMHLEQILSIARLDESSEHHVIFHEMIHGDRLVNGADLSYRMLARVASLVLAYPGQVHPLLSNHELAQWSGRGVSKGAGNNVELFNDGLEWVFGDEAESVAVAIGDFIRSFPLALITSNGVCCSHSLPNAASLDTFDIDILQRRLVLADYEHGVGSAYLMVWGRQWTPELIDSLRQAWEVKLFFVGHCHADTGIEKAADHLLVINSDHENARAVTIDLASDAPELEEAIISSIPLNSVQVRSSDRVMKQ
ncbi:MAG: hypothetical protein CMJ32_02860 [Phycisphaerae bacterium]|nr:hypothetical protein [Phycisphaerae bacterium]